MTRKTIFILLLLTVFVLSTSCSLLSEENADNPLLERYYLGTASGSYVLRFNEDWTVQIVGSGLGRDTDKRTSYYATYSVSGKALSLQFGKEEYSGVILEEGNKITFGENTFRNVDPKVISKKTLEVFD